MVQMKLGWLRRMLLRMLIPVITEFFNEVIEGRESKRIAEQLGVPDEKVDAVLQAVAQLLILKLEKAVGNITE
jgi:FixJ family two-component response regulator